MSKSYGDKYDFKWMAELENWIQLLVIEDGCKDWRRRALVQEGTLTSSIPSSSSGEEPICDSNPSSYPDSFFMCEENWQHRDMNDSVLLMLKSMLPDFFLLPKYD
ncbi:uncharacterized protein LOC131012658 [Salvia miltiorrhiza]|uniref:uncharacterized protein LOC131012658 n=1 Tax=Salvia miltiorrhiza TaxID=226208 RepID=UPI0025ACBFD9|nr:uncharacterized protein LOC131012658 [Salvia miltiorrhiza]